MRTIATLVLISVITTIVTLVITLVLLILSASYSAEQLFTNQPGATPKFAHSGANNIGARTIIVTVKYSRLCST